VVTGVANGQIVTLRYNSNGTLDTTFGNAGQALTNYGTTSSGNAVAVQNNGRIIVVGSANVSSGLDFAVLQYDGGVFAPTIVTQPQASVGAIAGGSATFSVSAVGSGTLSVPVVQKEWRC